MFMTLSIQRRGFSVAVLSSCFLPDTVMAQAQAPLEMGLLPNISARTLLSQYQPMREYLAHVLQRPVHLSTAPDWTVFHSRVAAIEYDLVATAPHMARLAQLDHGWMPLLQMLPDIKAMLVFAGARPMTAITDLRGKTLVLSNPLSLVALRGLRWLADNGLQRDKDFKTISTPTDDSVGNLLGRGDALAAVVSAGEFNVALPVHTRDEAGRLAAALNTMAATIQERVVALERSEQQQALLLDAARQERARLTTLLGALQIGILFVDAEQQVVYANALFSRMWTLNGLQPGTHMSEIVPLLTRQVEGASIALVEAMLSTVTDQPFVDREIIARDGRLIEQRMQVVGAGPDGQGGRIWLHEDVTVSRQTEQRAQLALYDSLTDLLNRRGLYETLEKSLVQAGVASRGLVLVFIDLDEFKHVNDMVGHRVGDQILVMVAKALAQALQPGETVARLGGDEFAVLNPGASAKDAQALALRLTQVVSALRFDADAQSLAVGCSMGLALFLAHARSADDLIACADTAMYQAKRNGKNGWCLYRDDVAHLRAETERVVWNGRIYRALRDQRLQMHYQPVLRMSDMGIAYHEALLRMVDEDDATQLIAPAEFVQHAERSGKIREIDRWVFETCIDMLARSRASVRISVSLSPRSLDDAGFVGFLRDALHRYSVDPRRLHIELTETAAMGDLASARPMIAALRSVGCAVHLDDFGGGFSSLAHLKLLEVDGIKIDGNFVRDLTSDASNRLVVSSLIDIARSMNKSTVAECVEDAATLEALRELGVDHVQGFHLGRPAIRMMESQAQDP
jgi:diguanylate cyclase (GGDEF)-like protein